MLVKTVLAQVLAKKAAKVRSVLTTDIPLLESDIYVVSFTYKRACP